MYKEKPLLFRIADLLWYALPLERDEDILKAIRGSNQQGFNETIFEKDFYLTVILHYLTKAHPEITFKGWTCLNKVFFPYFRLSEDLDFMMCSSDPLVDSTSKRQNFAQKMRSAMKHIVETLGRELNAEGEQHKKAQGHKHLKSKKYTYLKYLLTYPSLINWTPQHIKIELTYTEKQYFPAHQGNIQSLFIDPFFEKPLFPTETIRCLALEEMMSEKIRACLSRRVPAIRDFFDVRYVRQQGVDISDLKPIITEKLKENEGWNTINDQFEVLQSQIANDLVPMLGTTEISFDLKEIYDYILSLQVSIAC